mmetsp:Transcript_340/g.996  ORF Transcript_340/g.996 Transcript_340/m.996 type:complete len:267 (+) Transcript_340:261-1061(+)
MDRSVSRRGRLLMVRRGLRHHPQWHPHPSPSVGGRLGGPPHRRPTSCPSGPPCWLLRLVPPHGLPVLGEVQLERLNVLVKPEGRHGPQKIVPIDRLALFLHALVRRLGGDERYKFGHTLLHRLLGVLGNLGVLRESVLHDPSNVGDGQVSILLTYLLVLVPRGVLGVRHRLSRGGGVVLHVMLHLRRVVRGVNSGGRDRTRRRRAAKRRPGHHHLLRLHRGDDERGWSHHCTAAGERRRLVGGGHIGGDLRVGLGGRILMRMWRRS